MRSFPPATVGIAFRVLLPLLIILTPHAGAAEPISLVSRLDSLIPAVVAKGNAPSVQVAVIHGEEILWSRAFGEDGGVDRIGMIASVQKVVTAAAVLQLVEGGVIDLDTDVQQYVPFPLRHPDHPEEPITVRMLLAHRSGLGEFRHQFDWDTEGVFSPRYRPSAPEALSALSHEEFLEASLTQGGSNYHPRMWASEPGRRYSYSVSAYPLLRHLVGRVSDMGYEEYLREHIFEPLAMTSSGFSVDEFAERHMVGFARIGAKNVELPAWSGKASMMHSTAEVMARFALALMHGGEVHGARILETESVGLMARRTTRFKHLFRTGKDLPGTGHGLGLHSFRGGWRGFGGSVPGYQTLLRYHPLRQVGYVIMANVNGILGNSYDSARRDIYTVQDALVSILHPGYVVHRAAPGRVLLFAAAGVLWAFLVRRNPRLVFGAGVVWFACGALWTFANRPIGVAVLAASLVCLAWGGIGMVRGRGG